MSQDENPKSLIHFPAGLKTCPAFEVPDEDDPGWFNLHMDVMLERAIAVDPHLLRGLMFAMTDFTVPASAMLTTLVYQQGRQPKQTSFPLDYPGEAPGDGVWFCLDYPLKKPVYFHYEPEQDTALLFVGDLIYAVSQAYRYIYSLPDQYTIIGHSFAQLMLGCIQVHTNAPFINVQLDT